MLTLGLGMRMILVFRVTALQLGEVNGMRRITAQLGRILGGASTF